MTATSQFKNKNTIAYTIMVLLIIIMFHIFYGLDVLVPTNINWLMSARHDWGQHYLGWAFYRDEPWHFPLGKIDRLIYPAGTNVGYWDSIPILALFFKIFSFLLPQNFQYLGAWLLFCYLMAAHYTFKIFRLYNINYFLTLMAVLLVVGNPMLLFRGLHPALCAHGFILASIYFYLEPANAANVGKINKKQVWLVAISSLVNPYICLMVIGFNVILPLKHYFYGRLLTLKQALIYPAVSCMAVLACWLLLGMVTFGQGESLEVQNSYGIYAFNYNSFFNAGGFSMFLPQMPWVSAHQYESYMYLGLGLLILIGITLVYFLTIGKPVEFAKKHKWLLPLLILTVLMALFATTQKVTYNDRVLFEVPIPKLIERLGGVFRASARFFWIGYYLICLFFLVIFLKSRLPVWAKTTVLSLVVLLQAYDVKPLYLLRHLPNGDYDSPLDEAKWNGLLPHFDKIITYPPFNIHVLNPMDYQDLSLLALKHNQAISLGYSAREDGAAYKKYTDSLNNAIATGALQPKELYITSPDHLDMFSGMIRRKQLAVQYLDGYYLLYVNNPKIPLVPKTAQTKHKLDSITTAYSRSSFIRDIKLPVYTADKISANIEEIRISDNDIWVKGWAYLKDKTDNQGDSVFVMLADNDTAKIALTKQLKRPDLTTAFKGKYLEDAGFSAALFSDAPFNQNAHLAIAIKSKGAWTYTDLGTLNTLDRNKTPKKLDKLPAAGNQIGGIDQQVNEGSILILSGWSAFKDENNTDTEISIVFVANGINYSCGTAVTSRPDVTTYMGNKFDYNNTGFTVRVDTATLPHKQYKVAIMITNRKTGKQSIMMTDKTANIK